MQLANTTLNDLRKVLGAEDIYAAYGNFRQRVIMPAIGNC
ncbi:hypothetical protein [Anoxybacillus kestanbolensis]